MAHGYLNDGYGSHGESDSDRDDDRERGWRERNWGNQREGWPDREHGRSMMFGRGGRSEADQSRNRGDWREGARHEHGPGGHSDDRRGYSAHPDDHYRSWRDRHMSELDRDYQDYCREREQQFHRDFDDWRSQRRGNPQPLRTGMTQTGLSADPSGMTEAQTDAEPPTNGGSDPVATATLGTTSRGGGRR